MRSTSDQPLKEERAVFEFDPPPSTFFILLQSISDRIAKAELLNVAKGYSE
jgi:hypothetical protein